MTAVFIFRRDLRLHDNTTFIELVKRANSDSLRILPLFIFDPRQIDRTLNSYYSSNCVQFMIDALRDLDSQLKDVCESARLVFTRGSSADILEAIHAIAPIKLVAFNKDVTPFAIMRDAEVQLWCDRKGIELLSMDDYTMCSLDQVRTNKGRPFEIFTPFYRRAIRIAVPTPHAVPVFAEPCTELFAELTVKDEDLASYYDYNEHLDVVGGRKHALERLHNVRTTIGKSFKKAHDFPSKDATTHIGPYLKFGCISIREAYHAFKEVSGTASALVMQLYYRDFYYALAYHYPEILRGQLCIEKSTPLHGLHEKNEWNTDEDQFQKWAAGQTGYPIVDAAMRCLNKTGWIHNRLRMIAAMFLVRDINIDWRQGERYFAQQLVDYDPASNSQGWCWVLSYRRKFNPYKQTGKYDEQCEFVKKWVPELQDVPVVDLITWWEKYVNYPDLNYPKPMIEMQGYRVKLKTYIPDYVRPKDPENQKIKKPSKFGPNKNTHKYNKNKPKTTPHAVPTVPGATAKAAGTGRGFTDAASSIRGRGRGRGGMGRGQGQGRGQWLGGRGQGQGHGTTTDI